MSVRVDRRLLAAITILGLLVLAVVAVVVVVRTEQHGIEDDRGQLAR